MERAMVPFFLSHIESKKTKEKCLCWDFFAPGQKMHPMCYRYMFYASIAGKRGNLILRDSFPITVNKLT